MELVIPRRWHFLSRRKPASEPAESDSAPQPAPKRRGLFGKPPAPPVPVPPPESPKKGGRDKKNEEVAKTRAKADAISAQPGSSPVDGCITLLVIVTIVVVIVSMAIAGSQSPSDAGSFLLVSYL